MARFGRALVVLLVGVAVILAAVLTQRPNSPPSPSSDPLLPQPVLPSRATIRSVVVLDGVVRPVEPVQVKAPSEGIVALGGLEAGADLETGQTLMTIKGVATTTVTSPTAAVLMTLSVMNGQRVSIGDVLAVLAPARFRAEAIVEPALLYRLYTRPVSIRAQIDRGPAPFDCPYLSVGADLSSGGNPLDAPVVFRCAVPNGVHAFAGVRVELAVTTATAENALLVPVEAVEGTADSGVVTVVQPDGTQVRRAVTLGITDGVRVQVLSGLSDSDRILEFPSLGGENQPAASP
jgi:multidrug efflux pump subunit AcrA (membrane-fusion protein)